jgi:hypothetical protein
LDWSAGKTPPDALALWDLPPQPDEHVECLGTLAERVEGLAFDADARLAGKSDWPARASVDRHRA